jgi:hypothetical protein
VIYDDGEDSLQRYTDFSSNLTIPVFHFHPFIFLAWTMTISSGAQGRSALAGPAKKRGQEGLDRGMEYLKLPIPRILGLDHEAENGLFRPQYWKKRCSDWFPKPFASDISARDLVWVNEGRDASA